MKIWRESISGVSLLLWAGMLSFLACKTEKRGKDMPFTNALIHETSPYLLQHAHNPVNWVPWSKEALEQAREQDKLVLVSIGYSSCHWCHVMEEETFENDSVALIMNENFINIKVDREERPDVDHVYMTALQLLNGSGGWPLNVITLPNGKPLYGGTYHSKDDWMRVLKEISALYRDDPKQAEAYADRVAQGIQAVNVIPPAIDHKELTSQVLEGAVDFWESGWDMEKGGNKGSQKFMLPTNLEFLLDYSALSGNEAAKRFVKVTLDHMALGGIYDQLGGGFFRYSTDSDWKVPHFEKMLYDNAQMISLYARAYKVFKDPLYEQVVRQTTAFLEREMKGPEGGYYAAMNADSEGEEGKYYLWSMDELKKVLGAEFRLFSMYYSIEQNEAWEGDRFILYRKETDPGFRKTHQLSEEELDARKEQWGILLNARRKERVAPSVDDKFITSWNALLIKGYADAYKSLKDPAYLEKAVAIYKFLRQNNEDEKGLVHSYKKDSRRIDGFLEDYAFLTHAALSLYTAGTDQAYLSQARVLLEEARRRFEDADSGMYRYNSDKALISKILKTDDGVLPSPNAMMALSMYQLGHMDYNREYLKDARDMLAAMVPSIRQSPDTYGTWNRLFLHTVYPYFEIAIVGEKAGDYLQELQSMPLPNTLVLGSAEASELPLFKSRYVEDETFIYVCQNGSCRLPVRSVEEALKEMR